MSDQDAQDLNKMMSSSAEVPIVVPKKSKFIWVVLGCVVVGVGLGVVVYQSSLTKPLPSSKPSLKPSVASPAPLASPVIPQTNVVNPLPNNMTFPESGKLRLFSTLNSVTLVVKLVSGGQTNLITLPSQAITATKPMNFVDSTFEVTASSTATVEIFANSTSGTKMGGWILPTTDQKCGAIPATVYDFSSDLAWATTKLGAGKTFFAKQCWADQINTADPSSYDFNDFVLLWSYVPSTAASSSPMASALASATPSIAPSVVPSPSPSRPASPSPSPSVKASAAASVAATPTPTPETSPRVSMPDTTDGTPVTGIFEITVGTISVGIVFLLLGLFGLLVL